MITIFLLTKFHILIIQTEDNWDQYKEYCYRDKKGGDVFKSVFSTIVNSPVNLMLMTPKFVPHSLPCSSGSKTISP